MSYRIESPLAFIGAAVLFLPRLIRFAMKVDTDAVLEAFGRNERFHY